MISQNVSITVIPVKFISGRQLSPLEAPPKRQDEARGSRGSVERRMHSIGPAVPRIAGCHTVVAGWGREVHFIASLHRNDPFHHPTFLILRTFFLSFEVFRVE